MDRGARGCYWTGYSRGVFSSPAGIAVHLLGQFSFRDGRVRSFGIKFEPVGDSSRVCARKMNPMVERGPCDCDRHAPEHLPALIRFAGSSHSLTLIPASYKFSKS